MAKRARPGTGPGASTARDVAARRSPGDGGLPGAGRHPLAATDRIASGVMRAPREAGRRIPDDAAVAACDDIPVARDVRPALTTVHVPREEPGRAAVRLALRRAAPPDSRHLVLGTRVVLRDSTRSEVNGLPRTA
ncbi:hypothetical protein J2Z21_000943 [Streptomyces griseochromogenes]|uniref:Transcriptional regulator LacI/GalR-like sensor domain-containing protein n=1 Tax=Streptomyces griseochromogenes TaxID=68214 RepID=A0A1B1AUQ0_9ACTN|nr:hypothetical protein AVL59_12375 [Streptomyces griseochromogenes]MBP2048019.1 hypothetical protein [Streptomyces griseochromogenes]